MSKLTAGGVDKLADRFDEGQLIENYKTGASEAELAEAFDWLYNG